MMRIIRKIKIKKQYFKLFEKSLKDKDYEKSYIYAKKYNKI